MTQGCDTTRSSFHTVLCLSFLFIILFPAAAAGAEGDDGFTFVLYLDGVPLANANVTVYRDSVAPGNEVASLSTDDSGRFDLSLDNGTYIMVTSIDGENRTFPYRGLVRVDNGTLTAEGSVFHTGDTVPLHSFSEEEEDDGGTSGESSTEAGKSSVLCVPLFLIAVIIIGVVVLAAISYSRISGPAVLENATRQRIMNHIKDNPGIHFRALQRDLDIGVGALTHHLRTLEREEYIKAVEDGNMKHYFPASMTVQHEVHLSIPQQKILTAIKENPGISPAGIARLTGLSRKAVYYHTEILRQMSLIYVEKNGRELRCYPRG